MREEKNTKIIKIKEGTDLFEVLKTPGECLKNGGTVVFPTETVYGLGGNALSESSGQKIYHAKGRPSDNPLIVHIYKKDQLEDLVKNKKDYVDKLIDEFWPGPLTLIFEKKDLVPKSVTGGLDTVAVRLPNHKVALALLEIANVPVAAPSANISGRPSPTNAKRVIEDLDRRVDYIVDCGNSHIGLESTVLDVTGQIPMILRPGSVTQAMIKDLVGSCIVDGNLLGDKKDKPKSPGMKYKHYAPNAKVYLVDGEIEDILECIKSNEGLGKTGIILVKNAKNNKKNDFDFDLENCKIIYNENIDEYGATLFENLRKFDDLSCKTILVQTLENTGVGSAIMNRLLKASGGEKICKN